MVETTRDFAFQALKLHRLELEVFSFNPRAEQVYQKAGFRREGVRRDAASDGGRYGDSIWMAILEDEWRQLKRTQQRNYHYPINFISGGYTAMEKKEQLYEGKAKKVYATGDPNLVIVDYKDDATAFNGAKKGTITGKGVINNQMTNRFMAKLEKAGIPTHFVEELSERETLVKKVSIVPLEVIIRNISAGSFAKRYGVEEGIVFDAPTIEFSYKCDELDDPLLNTHHALALKLASPEEIAVIEKYAFAVNDFLKDFWSSCGVTLVDFKLEFGRLHDGTIVLADEISPDTCRLWDSKTHEKLDKDRFRRDLGGVEDAYAEVMRRMTEAL